MSGTPTVPTTPYDSQVQLSPPPVYVRSPPPAQISMVAALADSQDQAKTKGKSSGDASHTPLSQGSGASSITAVEMEHLPRQTSNSSQAKETHGQGQGQKTKYEEWYPGDARNNGRPQWWNRIFCCGYGLGCLLCPCSSWNCKHECS